MIFKDINPSKGTFQAYLAIFLKYFLIVFRTFKSEPYLLAYLQGDVFHAIRNIAVFNSTYALA